MRQTFLLLTLVVGTVYSYHTVMSDLASRGELEEFFDAPDAQMVSVLNTWNEESVEEQFDLSIDSTDVTSLSTDVEDSMFDTPPVAHIDE